MSTTEPTEPIEPTEEDTIEEDEVAGHRLHNRGVGAADGIHKGPAGDADQEFRAR